MSGNRVYANPCTEEAEEMDGAKVCTHAKVFRMVVSAFLVLVAVVFGGAVLKMNFGPAFVTVFAYISAQIGLWI